MKVYFKNEIVDLEGYKNIYFDGNKIKIRYAENILSTNIEVICEDKEEAEKTFYKLADLLVSFHHSNNTIDLRGIKEVRLEEVNCERRIRIHEENIKKLTMQRESLEEKEKQLNESIETIKQKIKDKEAEHGLTISELEEKEGGLSFFGKKKG